MPAAGKNFTFDIPEASALPANASAAPNDENWPADCAKYWQIANATARCLFVSTSPACDPDGGLVRYLAVYVCQVSEQTRPVYLSACAVWLLLLFVSLATTADRFFCPSLTVMSANLRLSHNLAGVTLLAFGNGAPDIFSSLAAVSQSNNGDASLAFGALLGAGIFVTTVVSAAVSAAKPFKTMERPLLKDISFYLCALYLTFYVLYRCEISLPQAFAFLALYAAFVAVTLTARLCRKCHRAGQQQRQAHVAGAHANTVNTVNSVRGGRASGGETAPLLQSYVPDELLADDGDASLTSLSEARLYAVRYAMNHPDPEVFDDEDDDDNDNDLGIGHVERRYGGGLSSSVAAVLQSVDLTTPLNSTNDDSVETSPAGQLLHRLAPVDLAAWKSGGCLAKSLELVKAPCLAPLNILIPVVDDSAPMRGWCRPLNCFQLATAPTLCLLASGLYSLQLGDESVLLVYIAVPALLLLAGVAYFLTNSDRPPVWHDFLAWLGFLAAVLVIYLVANEVVALLQAFGVLLDVSKAVLGLTLLAWGNSVGDMVSNVVLARRGYPRMAISACFGGPMFNLLVGVGLSFVSLLLRQGRAQMRLAGGRHDYLLLGTLCGSLCFSLVYSVSCRFRFGRVYAGILFTLYGAFLATALLVEFHVIRVFE